MMAAYFTRPGLIVCTGPGWYDVGFESSGNSWL